MNKTSILLNRHSQLIQNTPHTLISLKSRFCPHSQSTLKIDDCNRSVTHLERSMILGMFRIFRVFRVFFLSVLNALMVNQTVNNYSTRTPPLSPSLSPSLPSLPHSPKLSSVMMNFTNKRSIYMMLLLINVHTNKRTQTHLDLIKVVVIIIASGMKKG